MFWSFTCCDGELWFVFQRSTGLDTLFLVSGRLCSTRGAVICYCSFLMPESVRSIAIAGPLVSWSMGTVCVLEAGHMPFSMSRSISFGSPAKKGERQTSNRPACLSVRSLAFDRGTRMSCLRNRWVSCVFGMLLRRSVAHVLMIPQQHASTYRVGLRDTHYTTDSLIPASVGRMPVAGPLAGRSRGA